MLAAASHFHDRCLKAPGHVGKAAHEFADLVFALHVDMGGEIAFCHAGGDYSGLSQWTDHHRSHQEKDEPTQQERGGGACGDQHVAQPLLCPQEFFGVASASDDPVPRCEMAVCHDLFTRLALAEFLVEPWITNDAFLRLEHLLDEFVSGRVLRTRDVRAFGSGVDHERACRRAGPRVECVKVAGLAELQALDPCLEVLQTLRHLHSDEDGADHLSRAVLKRHVARHVRLVEERGLAGELRLRKERPVTGMLAIELRADRAFAVRRLQRRRNTDKIVAVAGEQSRYRAGRGRKLVYLVELVVHSVVSGLEAGAVGSVHRHHRRFVQTEAGWKARHQQAMDRIG